CGHCKNLVPEYKKAATVLKGIVKVGAVDVTRHESIGASYGVQGFPTIKIFGLDKAKPTDYNGARTAQGISDALLAEVKKAVSSRLGGSGRRSEGQSSGGQDDKIRYQRWLALLVNSYFATRPLLVQFILRDTVARLGCANAASQGSFDKDGIREFLRDLSYGKGQTAPIKGATFPAISKTEPWDGKDGVPPKEEDIDLSDVDLEHVEL
ncbi:hypothetical protein GCK32_010974, partial [Trichostrongylus colubriformis]